MVVNTEHMLSESTDTPSRIAFGSCNDQDLQNHLWPIIESRKPAAFIWGGDAIYGDVQLGTDWSTFPPVTHKLKCADPERLQRLYQKQREVPGYRRLLEQNLTIFGGWDDHDYGCNNADRLFQFKYESGLAFCDFLGIHKESVMYQRARQGQGVYGVILLDFARPADQILVPESEAGIDPDLVVSNQPHDSHSAGLMSNRTVAVFVLDVRTNKTPWKKGPAAYEPDYQGDFLGERQWTWLESALRRSKAAVNVVVNGLQVHANRFPDGNVAEAWGKYPTAQQRLFRALLQEGVQAPLLISGDVHMAQLMRKDCVRADALGLGSLPSRPLIEMTTSGMTHSWGTLANPRLDRPYEKPTWRNRYESLVAGNMMRMLHYVCPWTDLMDAPRSTNRSGKDGLFVSGGGEGAKRGLQFSLVKNFGELEFDWEKRSLTMRVWGEEALSPPLLMASLSLDQLSGIAPTPLGQVTQRAFANEAAAAQRVSAAHEWVCVNHRGRENLIAHVLGHLTTGVVLTTLVPVPLLLPTVVIVLFIRRVSRTHSLRLKARAP